VVAYGKGGALETVIPLNPGGENPLQRNSATGIFFYQQNAAALTSAVRKMEENLSRFSPELLRAQALRFDRRVFEARILEFIGREWTRFQSRLESMT
jgi:glycogen synthase